MLDLENDLPDELIGNWTDQLSNNKPPGPGPGPQMNGDDGSTNSMVLHRQQQMVHQQQQLQHLMQQVSHKKYNISLPF